MIKWVVSGPTNAPSTVTAAAAGLCAAADSPAPEPGGPEASASTVDSPEAACASGGTRRRVLTAPLPPGVTVVTLVTRPLRPAAAPVWLYGDADAACVAARRAVGGFSASPPAGSWAAVPAAAAGGEEGVGAMPPPPLRTPVALRAGAPSAVPGALRSPVLAEAAAAAAPASARPVDGAARACPCVCCPCVCVCCAASCLCSSPSTVCSMSPAARRAECRAPRSARRSTAPPSGRAEPAPAPSADAAPASPPAPAPSPLPPAGAPPERPARVLTALCSAGSAAPPCFASASPSRLPRSRSGGGGGREEAEAAAVAYGLDGPALQLPSGLPLPAAPPTLEPRRGRAGEEEEGARDGAAEGAGEGTGDGGEAASPPAAADGRLPAPLRPPPPAPAEGPYGLACAALLSAEAPCRLKGVGLAGCWEGAAALSLLLPPASPAAVAAAA